MSIISLISPTIEKRKTLQLVDIIQNDIPFKVNAGVTTGSLSSPITHIGRLMVLTEAALTISTTSPLTFLLGRISYNDNSRSEQSARVLKQGYAKSFRSMGLDLQFLGRFPFPRDAIDPKLGFTIANGDTSEVLAIGKYSIEVWDFV